MSYTRVLIGTMLLVCGTAHAESFQVTPLGQTVPLWYEHSVGVNDVDTVAWTKIDAGSPRAMAWHNEAPVNLDALLSPQPLRSYALDVETNGDIVGYTAANARETARSAVYWEVNGPSFTPQLLPPPVGTTPVQSAAYAVARSSTSPTSVIVGGYVRDRVSATTLSKPVVWTGAPGALVAKVMDVDTNGYGIVYGVADDGVGNQQACGSHGAGGAYAFAACWNPVSGERTMLSLSKPGKTIASSVVRRVRTIPLGAAGTATFAVGTVAYSTGESEGFVYRLAGPSSILETQWVDGVAANSSSMVMDLSETSFPGPSAGTDYGMVAIGMGATTATVGYETIMDSTGLSGHVYHGISKTFLPMRDVEGGVCDIQDETASGLGDASVAASNNGDTRVVWSGNTLSVYRAHYPVAKPEVLVRDTVVTVRPALFGKSAITETPQHYQARVAGTSSLGMIRWSSEPGCASMVGTGMTDCSNARASLGSGLNPSIIAASGGMARTETVQGEAPDTTTFRYVQASLGTNATSCEISPVYASDSVIVPNPQADFNGEVRDWQNCDADLANGYETDVRRDYNHCGACNTPIVEDGKWCTLDQCVNGSVNRSILEANSCHISGACYSHGDKQPIAYGGEPSTTRNFCRECRPATKQTAFTNVPQTCCVDGVPQITKWHRGYRPATPGNITYSGTTLTSTWIRRIAEVNDGHLWADLNGFLCISTSYDCQTDNDKSTAPKRLRSHLTGFADQEDWFVFRHVDLNNQNSKNSEPRVRVVPTNNADVKLCVYAYCYDSPATTLEYMQYASEGSNVGVRNVTGSASPLHNGSRSLEGYCRDVRGAGGAEDIEILLEGAPNPKCWNVDIFVQVTSGVSTPLMCGQSYDLYWGNDQYYNCGSGYHGWGCAGCCDGKVDITNPP